ncbi:right-handed parallel beta-helix repeat-containing protein [Paenibacillus elgii]|nr:right-handed parallel beta-helix repeat-containing protein [Paenibacillus elgii]
MSTSESSSSSKDKAMSRRELLATMGTATAGIILAAGTGWSGTAAAEPMPNPMQNPGFRPESVAWINVKNYGAQGLGRFDQNDAPAIQSAVEAAGPMGGTVYLPPGRYILRSSIMLRPNVRLVGDGPGASILKAAESNLSMVMGLGTKKNAVEGLGFEGMGALSLTNSKMTERGVYFEKCEHVSVRNCHFTAIVNGVWLNDSRHVSVSQSSFSQLFAYENFYEGYGIFAESAANFRLTDNRFHLLKRPCIYISAGSSYSIVSDNVAQQCEDAFIVVSSKLKPSSYHRIEGNILSAEGLENGAFASKQGIVLRDYCTDNVIVHNVISRAKEFGISLTGDGAAADERPFGNIVSGNKIDQTERGIVLLNSDVTTVAGNDVRRVQTGIALGTSGNADGSFSRHNLVTGNMLSRCSTAAIQIAGSRCENNVVYGNAGTGNGEGLTDQGKDTSKTGF